MFDALELEQDAIRTPEMMRKGFTEEILQMVEEM